MGRNSKHDILFEPVRIGPKIAHNRFYQVPHCTGFGTYKPHSQAHLRAMKAEGGWAVVCTEFAPISPESDNIPSHGSNLWDADDARNLAAMCRAVQSHGALAGIQLAHKGVHSGTGETRWHRVGASQLPSDLNSISVAKEMDRTDIVRVQNDWARAARAAREIGFDLIYIYVGDSYLPMQFLSEFYNKRTDDYGGSFENRARFFLETLARVREEVDGSCAVAVRMSVEALGPAGLSLDEALQVIKAADGLVDLWDVKIGTLGDMMTDAGTSRFVAENHQFSLTSRVREVTSKPIVGVGRLTDPDQMVENIRSGAWDLIGAARPSIADPFLPKKIEEGRYDEIRECIGANECLARHTRGHLGCTQNATAGEEYRRGWHPERFTRAQNADRDVLVIGAGPAGMECAIVLGKRGFGRVHLVDANAEPGGAFRWIPTLPGLGQWGRIVNWRAIQLGKLPNVELITGLRLDAEAVRDYGAEIVVVATGSRWAEQGLCPFSHEAIPGADARLGHVMTPEQIMRADKRAAGERIVVYDCEGDFLGTCLAERLALEGHAVTFVTSLEEVSPTSVERYEGALVRRRLHELGIAMHRRMTVAAVHEDRVEARDEFGEPLVFAADALVLLSHRVSNDGLYRELVADPQALAAEEIEAVYRVGGAVAPVQVGDAIFDGHRLAREIDSPNPAIPMPYKREQVFVTDAGE